MNEFAVSEIKVRPVNLPSPLGIVFTNLFEFAVNVCKFVRSPTDCGSEPDKKFADNCSICKP